jgi:hypothetical protein
MVRKSCFERVFSKAHICLGRSIGSFVLNSSDCGLIYNRFGDTFIRQWNSGHSSLLFLGQLHTSGLFVVKAVDSVDLLCPSMVSCKTWNLESGILESWNLGILESWNPGILESYHITAKYVIIKILLLYLCNILVPVCDNLILSYRSRPW